MTLQADITRADLGVGRRTTRAWRALPLFAALCDLGAVACAIALAAFSREHLFEDGAMVFDSVLVVGPLMLLGTVAGVAVLGGYRPEVFGAGTDEFKRVFNAGLLAAGLTGVGCYLANFPLSRGFFLIAFGVGVPATVTGRWLLRRALHSARRRGVLTQRVLIAGSPSHVDEVAAVIRRESWLGYHVVGALTPATHERATTHSGLPVFGDCEQVSAIAAEAEADVVFFAGGAFESAGELRRRVWELESAPVQVVVAPSVTDISSDRVKVRPVGGLPLMHIDPPTWTDASRWGKRAFDVVGAGVLLVLLAPAFAVIALLVKRDDGGPVLFRQNRIGRNGEEFDCLKFRSMVPDAEARLAALHAAAGHSDGLFKMKDDPRITGPGRWLRRLSLDELPQLVNVVRGEMSLVGPRPPLRSEVDRYEADTTRRLHVRPGMTGLWQVSGRSDLSWEEAVRLDLYYVDNWSMLQDLSILVKTVRAVTASSGAY